MANREYRGATRVTQILWSTKQIKDQKKHIYNNLILYQRCIKLGPRNDTKIVFYCDERQLAQLMIDYNLGVGGYSSGLRTQKSRQ